MSGGPKFSPFLPRRRRGAGKESEEPHIVPNPIRLNFGMGDEISILFSAPPRENKHNMASLTRTFRKSRIFDGGTIVTKHKLLAASRLRMVS